MPRRRYINKIITKKINDINHLKIRQEKLKETETMFNINDFMKLISIKDTVQKVQQNAQIATDALLFRAQKKDAGSKSKKKK